ncbi:polysaccharide biosynthesis/export family protein [Pedobacter sp. SYSU D00535]|uniref:polysaccharide biosynthesis/export family protein n=1 Tax=Pedobacter sp. SYSU D00535 TaxID=2810308 RepID=UPI001A97CFFD|nr:polysaccharide biosynthesis/export family protein [Pedobacter sp. SYSU D00535]
MKIRLHYLYFLLFVLTFSSCNSYKKIAYFQDLNKNASREDVNNFTPLKVETDDVLGISVTSLNPEASSIFNYNLNTINGTSVNNAANPVIGYVVDSKGDIFLPLIGSMKVQGLTLTEVRDQIRKRLLTYLREPVVNIRLLNFKVSVLGDVARPGSYPVQSERITVTEAIALAGDLNITAQRDNILLVREREGKREYIPIDLTSKRLFNSPYYYLRSNDVLYIQPGKVKYASVDNSYRTVGLLLSALSVIAIILTR